MELNMKFVYNRMLFIDWLLDFDIVNHENGKIDLWNLLIGMAIGLNTKLTLLAFH